MGVAFALLAPADPRAIAALDHAETRLDDLHSVVLRVVILDRGSRLFENPSTPARSA